MYTLEELQEGLARFDSDLYGEWIKLSGILEQFNFSMLSQFHGLCRIDSQILRSEENSKLEKKPVPFWDHHELSTISYLWILGVYEIVRTLTEKADPNRSDHTVFESVLPSLKKLRNKLELVRMPLAKFEIAKKADMQRFDLPFAYPAWHPDKGVSWQIGTSEFISRKDISDELMTVLIEINNKYGKN